MIGEVAALFAAFCFSIAAVLYRNALEHTRPISASIARCTLTGSIILLFLLIAGRLDIFIELPPKTLLYAVLAGVIGLGLGDVLYMYSLKTIGVTRAVPISASYPLFSILWDIVFLGEVMTAVVVLGAITVFVGVWLLSSEKPAESNESQANLPYLGILAALGASIVWSINLLLTSGALALIEPNSIDLAFAINTLRIISAAGFLLFLSPLLDRRFEFLRIPQKSLGALVAAGIIALAIGWFSLTLSFFYSPASRVVPLSSTTPFFATLGGVFLLHEPISKRIIGGSIVVVAGIFLLFAF